MEKSITLTEKEADLIASLLSDYSERLGNDCCNDWNFPPDWTLKEIFDIKKEYHQLNGDPEEFNVNHLQMQNNMITWYFARKLSDKI